MKWDLPLYKNPKNLDLSCKMDLDFDVVLEGIVSSTNRKIR